jgi:hypothetical protein
VGVSPHPALLTTSRFQHAPLAGAIYSLAECAGLSIFPHVSQTVKPATFQNARKTMDLNVAGLMFQIIEICTIL